MSTVAFLGPQGTFTEAAATRLVPGATLIPVSSPAAALACVQTREAEFAVVAIENSVDGPVTPTFDALAATEGLQIYAEIDLDVAFSIAVRPSFTGVSETFVTHPVAWQQVQGWVKENMPGVRFVPASSNADAARMVAEGEADVAAAPARAVEMYGLRTLAAEVADHKGARTRFVRVGLAGRPPQRTGSDRTSVAFTLPNEPGSLVRALNEFAVRGVDLSRIESRPTKSSFGTYRFFADLHGHIDDTTVAEAIRALYLHAEQLIFLGSWPAATSQVGDNGCDSRARLAAADAFIRRLQTGEPA
ncbi:prephenate dehydratase [Corynebacterium epidermidicanis]|uniref:Prephenate dehydratase n=1 Tax=Corynebacterium epidermidicanis TaxID=1050174 RepID=A0A0G3GSP7_9CORY|nr:prephenate dehydratase [Corynebacterium epidermidicanis]AKK04176.1 prephenate dehydratase [Corynebacterium epidermidicanis]